MAKSKFFKTAFSRHARPTIACINAATVDLRVDFDQMIRALQTFLDDCFAPIWGAPAKLVKAKAPIPNTWTLILLDDADTKDAEGYHEITKNGLPLAKVFVKPTLKARDKVSVTASHELAELLVDPAVNLWSDGPRGTLWAYEVCDAVEEAVFKIDGIAMSDFVYPTFFELFRMHDPEPTQFDYLKKVKHPFQLLKGGYAEVRKGKAVREKYGSKEKQRRFRKEDRRFHRSEFRKQEARRAKLS